MGHRDIPDAAVEAGAPASAYLLRALRDNQRAADHNRQALAARLDETIGHAHGQGVTVATSYTFSDRIITKTGVNDKLDFRFGGTSQTAADCVATLTAGTRTPTAHAAHIQAQMRSAASSSTEIGVTYDTDPASVTRGLFLIQHTGASDSPHPRVLWLLFGTGANAARSAAPSFGYAKIDRKKAFGYRGDSGFSDSFTENTITLGDGGILHTADFVNQAFTTAKFSNGVCDTAAFDTGAVTGGKTANGVITGPKAGAPGIPTSGGNATVSIASGGSATFGFTQPNASMTPHITPYTTDATGAAAGELTISNLTNTSGNIWSFHVNNNSPGGLSGCGATLY